MEWSRARSRVADAAPFCVPSSRNVGRWSGAGQGSRGSRRRALLCTLEVGHSDEAIGVRFEVLAAMEAGGCNTFSSAHTITGRHEPSGLVQGIGRVQ